jgi:Terpene cyclase DEP1
MQRQDRVLCGIYAAVAAAALIATWSQNIRFFLRDGNGGLAGFLSGAWANPAAASLSNDVVFVALAAVVLMVVEARRLGVRYVWAYVVGAAVIAISVTFPLFLIARQRRLAELRTESETHR